MAGNFKIRDYGRLNRILEAVYLFYCRCRFGRGICLIPLTRHKFAIVEAEDYERLRKFNWHARYSSRTWYAARCVLVAEKRNNRLVWMHNEIVKSPKGRLVDHRNHNGLDNRKTNLRIATRGQNRCNCRKREGCTSKFKGVAFRDKNRGRKHWLAYINAEGRRMNLGVFMTEAEAARAYDKAARKYHKEFARLNFPV